jgi:glutaredoxin
MGFNDFPKNNNIKWLIYTKDGCRACEDAKKFFDSRNITFEKKNGIDPVTNKDTIEVQKRMKIVRKPFKTWPKIFRNDEFIGGFIDLKKRYLEN